MEYYSFKMSWHNRNIFYITLNSMCLKTKYLKPWYLVNMWKASHTQQELQSFSVANIIFDGQGTVAENNLFSAAVWVAAENKDVFSAATDTALENRTLLFLAAEPSPPKISLFECQLASSSLFSSSRIFPLNGAAL